MSTASRRRWPVGVDPRKERRQVQAQTRKEHRAARSAQEQLAILGARPGKSVKERKKLSS